MLAESEDLWPQPMRFWVSKASWGCRLMRHRVPVPHSNTLGNFAQDEHERDWLGFVTIRFCLLLLVRACLRPFLPHLHCWLLKDFLISDFFDQTFDCSLFLEPWLILESADLSLISVLLWLSFVYLSLILSFNKYWISVLGFRLSAGDTLLSKTDSIQTIMGFIMGSAGERVS